MIRGRLPIRGGNWNNAANAGLFALNLNNVRSNSNTNIGFRPAFERENVPEGRTLRGAIQRIVQKDLFSSAKRRNSE